jgi:hypothetical protein
VRAASKIRTTPTKPLTARCFTIVRYIIARINNIGDHFAQKKTVFDIVPFVVVLLDK